MDDWIEWNGGECPVDGEVEVEVELRSGYRETCRASEWCWDELAGGAQIIRYRVIRAETPEPTETLRDRFAMAALTGMLGDPSFDPSPEEVARLAYRIADIMMKERAK